MENEFFKILLLDMNIIYKVLYVFNAIWPLIFKIWGPYFKKAQEVFLKKFLEEALYIVGDFNRKSDVNWK